MAAFYKARVSEFLAEDPAKLMLELTLGTAGMGFDLKPDQHASWLTQLEILASALRSVSASDSRAAAWSILLEYAIPGRPKRMDAVLLDGFGIIAVEFKIGATEFRSGDRWQLREYCWNLRDFHRESQNVPIVPILVATSAPAEANAVTAGFEDKHSIILPMLSANAANLSKAILSAHSSLLNLGAHPFDICKWEASQAHTTRSIIEEAQQLFAAHDVREISHARADNTTDAQKCLIDIVRHSRVDGLRSICFVTGVPGAGKTLVGLHASYSHAMTEAAGTPACFASGNQPLLDVLHAALTLNRTRMRSARREVSHELSAPVQNVHDFAIRNLLDPQRRAPNEHVVVFDEAQRVWTATKVKEGIAKRVRRRQLSPAQALQILGHPHSEPELLLNVMGRCPDWCVVIALVGGGQEIYDGEAGLRAWGEALSTASSSWTVWVAQPALEGDASVAGQTLFPEGRPQSIDVRHTEKLHLSVSKRTPHAESYAEWVNHLLANRPEKAAELMAKLEQFPILLTRDLSEAKNLIREYAGASSRYGLVASSGAIRLRAEGIELKREFRNALKYPDWFLKCAGDIRSSNQLEIAATEFECQGLELDWTLVCWGGDLIPDLDTGKWLPRCLSHSGKHGPRWRPEEDLHEQDFIRNKYRVLLTRARFGTVIYVPRGDATDATRSPQEFDAIANFLFLAGLVSGEKHAFH